MRNLVSFVEWRFCRNMINFVLFICFCVETKVQKWLLTYFVCLVTMEEFHTAVQYNRLFFLSKTTSWNGSKLALDYCEPFNSSTGLLRIKRPMHFFLVLMPDVLSVAFTLTLTFGVLFASKKILSTENRDSSEFIDEVLCRRSIVSAKIFRPTT
jgi:hypothetical protein